MQQSPRRRRLFWPICLTVLSVFGWSLYALLPPWPLVELKVSFGDEERCQGRITYISPEGRVVKLAPIGASNLRKLAFARLALSKFAGLLSDPSSQVSLPILEVFTALGTSHLHHSRELDKLCTAVFPECETLVITGQHLSGIRFLHLRSGKEAKMLNALSSVGIGHPFGEVREPLIPFVQPKKDKYHVKVFDMAKWKLINTPIQGGFDFLQSNCVDVSRDGKRLIIAELGKDGFPAQLQLWDLESMRALKSHALPKEVLVYDMSMTGDRAILMSADYSRLHFLDTGTGNLRTFKSSSFSEGFWVCSADGRRLACCPANIGLIPPKAVLGQVQEPQKRDDHFALWNTETGDSIMKLPLLKDFQILGVWFIEEANLFFAMRIMTNGNELHAWNMETGKPVWSIKTSCEALYERPGRPPLLVSDSGQIDELNLVDGTVRSIQPSQREKDGIGVWNRQRIVDFDPINPPSKAVLFSRNGDLVLSTVQTNAPGWFERLLKLLPFLAGESHSSWTVRDTDTGQVLLRPRLPRVPVGNVMFSKDRTTLAIVQDPPQDSSTLTVWDLTRRRERWIGIVTPPGLLMLIVLWRRIVGRRKKDSPTNGCGQ